MAYMLYHDRNGHGIGSIGERGGRQEKERGKRKGNRGRKEIREGRTSTPHDKTSTFVHIYENGMVNKNHETI